MPTDDLPHAYLVHQLRSRFRVRVCDKRGEPEYFAAVRERVAAVDGVDEVRTSDISGSILVIHPERGFAELLPALDDLRLFHISDRPQPRKSPFTPIQAGLSAVDQGMRQNSGDGINLRTLGFITMLGLALYQIKRGQFLGPAVPMLWNAFELMLKTDDHSDSGESGSIDEFDGE